ncbi:hypothetical protein CYMTET_42236 [Cymbomonas tetramitiformis]|uniref:Inner centromere protein ARK-binding domain-containing protein n=1 Tax=Cymbomonas tetramitiformis TaxID=36881 RepID=A0AAE0C5L4_9CHLO|nr:hypothetical protein CYMTET_42236 [Cymbomonas tetramitiformis]
MADKFEACLEALCNVRDEKVKELDSEADVHRVWLAETLFNIKSKLTSDSSSPLRYLPSAKKPKQKKGLTERKLGAFAEEDKENAPEVEAGGKGDAEHDCNSSLEVAKTEQPTRQTRGRKAASKAKETKKETETETEATDPAAEVAEKRVTRARATRGATRKAAEATPALGETVRRTRRRGAAQAEATEEKTEFEEEEKVNPSTSVQEIEQPEAAVTEAPAPSPVPVEGRRRSSRVAQKTSPCPEPQREEEVVSPASPAATLAPSPVPAVSTGAAAVEVVATAPEEEQPEEVRGAADGEVEVIVEPEAGAVNVAEVQQAEEVLAGVEEAMGEVEVVELQADVPMENYPQEAAQKQGAPELVEPAAGNSGVQRVTRSSRGGRGTTRKATADIPTQAEEPVKRPRRQGEAEEEADMVATRSPTAEGVVVEESNAASLAMDMDMQPEAAVTEAPAPSPVPVEGRRRSSRVAQKTSPCPEPQREEEVVSPASPAATLAPPPVPAGAAVELATAPEEKQLEVVAAEEHPKEVRSAADGEVEDMSVELEVGAVSVEAEEQQVDEVPAGGQEEVREAEEHKSETPLEVQATPPPEKVSEGTEKLELAAPDPEVPALVDPVQDAASAMPATSTALPPTCSPIRGEPVVADANVVAMEDAPSDEASAEQVPEGEADAQLSEDEEFKDCELAGEGDVVAEEPTENRPQGGIIRSAVAGVASFLSFVPKAAPPPPVAAGKKAGRVKALEAAEASRKAEEAKQAEKQSRKQQLAQQRSQLAAAGVPSSAPISAPRAVAAEKGPAQAASSGAAAAAPSGSVAGTPKAGSVGSSLDGGHVQRMKSQHEARVKIAEENRRRLDEDKRRREEEKQRKEDELLQKRRAKEAAEKKDREDRARKAKQLQEEHARRAAEQQARKKEEEEERRRQKVERLHEAARQKPEVEGTAKRCKMEKSAQPLQQPRADAAATTSASINTGNFISPPPKESHSPNAQAMSKLASCDVMMCAAASPGSIASGTGVSTSIMPPPPPRNPTPAKLVAAQLDPQSPPPQGLQSITIPDYKSDSDSDGDSPDQKDCAVWARRDQLDSMLKRQGAVDPDEIFQWEGKTCSLEEVFEGQEKKKKSMTRRNSSGNWVEDRLTWKEELKYKIGMGYVS